MHRIYKKLHLTLFIWLFCICSASLAYALDYPTDAENKIMLLDKTKGFIPESLVLDQNDASVFFFNGTDNPISDFSLAFGKNRVHCHNPSIQPDGKGNLTSIAPIVPNSFVIACFPESDSYKVSARIEGKLHTGTVVVRKSK